MYISEVFYDELEDRIDARYYGPKYIENLRLLKNLSKNPNFQLIELGDVTGKIKKGIFSIFKSEYKNEGIPFIRVSNIKNFTIDMNDIIYISTEKDELENKTSMKPGDLVISKGGTIGKVALIPKWAQRWNISQDIIGISLKENQKIKTEYIAIFLMSKFGQLQMERVKTQQIQAHLTLGYISKLKILIANKIYDNIVNMVISAENNNKLSFQKILQAKEIVNKEFGIDFDQLNNEKSYFINSYELKDSFTPKYYYPKYIELLKLIKEKFETISLGTIADIDRGTEVGSKNYKSYLNKKDDDYPFIRTSDFVNCEIDLYPDYYVGKMVYEKINQDLKPQDILFTKDGKIGLVTMIVENDKCIIASGIARLRVKKEFLDKIDPHYLFLILTTNFGLFQAYQKVVVASTIPHLQSERFFDIAIPILPDKSRKEISKLVKEAFILMNERKKSLMTAKEELEKNCNF